MDCLDMSAEHTPQKRFDGESIAREIELNGTGGAYALQEIVIGIGQDN